MHVFIEEISEKVPVFLGDNALGIKYVLPTFVAECVQSERFF